MTPRRSLRLLLALLVLAAVAAATTAAVRYARDDGRRDYLGTDGWPRDGQASWQLVGGLLQSSPAQRPVPIASVAKVMTAYVVLVRYPTAAFTITVTSADVADTERRAERDESLVRVRSGERLTGLQALEALLLPSANNVAIMLARRISGSVAGFVAVMNRTARGLRMTRTTYTDPSGFDARTVSIAADQVRLAQAAMRLPLFRRIVGMRTAVLPVAGTVHNTDRLLGSDGFAGIKTGSMDASGGCFVFLAHRREGELYGAVLGQHGDDLLAAGLYAARQLADHVAALPGGS